MSTSIKAPMAKRVPYEHVEHGDVRQDDYQWLRDKTNPEVIQYLEAENAYYHTLMEPLKDKTEKLYEEMVARIPESEVNVPVQDGPYYYYSRIDKSLQYPVYARKRANNRTELEAAPEEVLLDLNILAKDKEYYSVAVQRVSPNHEYIAYLENLDGTDKHTLRIKNLVTGEMLPDEVGDIFIYGSLEWGATGEYVYYVTVDDTQRPYRVWRHRVGTANAAADELLYEEKDITFTLTLYKSQSGRYLFLHSSSKITSEVHVLDASDVTSSFAVFAPRKPGVEYEMEHWGNDFLILTNENAQNFRVLHCPVTDTSPSARVELFPYNADRYLQGIVPFHNALLVVGREGGSTQIWTYRDGQLSGLSWPEPIYTVNLGGNRSYDTNEALLVYESFLTPRTTYGFDLETGEKTVLQVAPVSGTYDAALYRQERVWATASDGVQVPMAAVYKADALASGPAPLILYGYGSYGANTDPRFDATRLPLLDRGVVYVIAQIRGGSEMGRSWYENGKFLAKRNTFTDFIAAAEDLIQRGYTTPTLMAARGGSAGGLLLGAVANMAGHLFKVMTPAVPFVDVVSTILDASIPLTSLEWDEWGDPREVEYYHYMKSYSPYDNVEAKDYPHMFVTTGLNDPRVAYWEPAKWVARLRAVKTDNNTLLLKTNMGAGHFGASGRLNHIKEMAESFAFVLDKLGVEV